MIVNAGGGPVLATPKFIPVFWSNDDATLVTATEGFFAGVGGSDYWAAIGAEYGVGKATSGTPIQIATPVTGTVDDSQIQPWLISMITSDARFSQQLDDNTVFGLMYPSGVTITDAGGTSCPSGFYGYHSEVNVNGKDVPYMVLPRCSTDAGNLAQTTSHEMIESATDPYPDDKPAYFVETDYAYFAYANSGGEVADMCGGNWYSDADLGLVLPRSWSNVAAAAGHNPCMPRPAGEIYFNSAPALPDMVSWGGVTVVGAQIPVGGSKTIPLALFSDAPTGAWTVTATDFLQLMNETPILQFSMDKTSGANGDTINLTIDVPSALPMGADVFLITSTLTVAGVAQKNYWFGVVSN